MSPPLFWVRRRDLAARRPGRKGRIFSEALAGEGKVAKPGRHSNDPFPAMTIEIRRADEADIDLLLPLFVEMQRHYVGADAIGSETARPRLLAALKPVEGRAILLASEGNAALGFACLYEMFPGADLDPAWFLKELYVTAAARGHKVGEALTRAAARLAVANGASRLDLTTGAGETNEPVRRFYARLDMDLVPKVYFRAEGAALEALAGDGPQL